MPLPMVHLAVGYELNRIQKMGSLKDFYVGNIAPDAIHMREGTDREDKKRSHLHCKNMVSELSLLEAIEDFYSRETAKRGDPGHRAFTLGYCTHLLTDYYWFRTVFPDFISKVPYEIHSEPFKKLYYHDTDLIDGRFYARAEWRESVWDMLSASGSNSNSLLNEGEISRWVSRTLTWFSPGRYDPGESPVYINHETAGRFVGETSGKIHQNLLRMNVL